MNIWIWVTKVQRKGVSQVFNMIKNNRRVNNSKWKSDKKTFFQMKACTENKRLMNLFNVSKEPVEF